MAKWASGTQSTSRESESEIQKKLCKWLESRGIVYHSTPNEGAILAGGRSKWIFAIVSKLKAMGLQSGYPDLSIDTPPPAKPRARVKIELKSAKGNLSEKQKVWVDKLTGLGDIVVIAYGIDDAIKQLEELGY